MVSQNTTVRMSQHDREPQSSGWSAARSRVRSRSMPIRLAGRGSSCGRPPQCVPIRRYRRSVIEGIVEVGGAASSEAGEASSQQMLPRARPPLSSAGGGLAACSRLPAPPAPMLPGVHCLAARRSSRIEQAERHPACVGQSGETCSPRLRERERRPPAPPRARVVQARHPEGRDVAVSAGRHLGRTHAHAARRCPRSERATTAGDHRHARVRCARLLLVDGDAVPAGLVPPGSDSTTTRPVMSRICRTRWRFRSRRVASTTTTVTSGRPNRMKSRATSSSALSACSE